MSQVYNRMKELGVIPFDMRQPIYKYRSIESAIRIIETNQIYFPTAKELDDIFELDPSHLIQVTQAEKETYLRNSLGQDLQEYPSDDLFNNLIVEYHKTNIGIFSAGRSATNADLWEHYGDQRKGVCFGFRFGMPFPNHLAFSVKYLEGDPDFKIKVFDDENDLSNDMFAWLCLKRKSFSFEDEIRVIDSNNFGIKPFPKNILVDVIFGYETSIDNQNRILGLLEQYRYPIQRIGKITDIEPIFLNK